MFDTWGVWSFEDRNAWNVALQDWLGSLGTETVEVEFDEVRGAQQGEMAWVSAIVTYSARDADGEVTQSMQNRLSWSLVKTASRWLIAHEHTSAPIGFGDQKAILTRA